MHAQEGVVVVYIEDDYLRYVSHVSCLALTPPQKEDWTKPASPGYLPVSSNPIFEGGPKPRERGGGKKERQTKHGGYNNR